MRTFLQIADRQATCLNWNVQLTQPNTMPHIWRWLVVLLPCLCLGLSRSAQAQWTQSDIDILNSNSFFGLWTSNPGNVWAVGNSGRIRKWTGNNNTSATSGSWANQVSNTTSQLRTVWGTSSSNIWAVGSGGTILHYNGSSWSVQTSNTTENLFGVWGSSANDVWAVGSQGVIVRYDGTTWTPQTISTAPVNPGFNAIWGSDANNVWAVAGVGIIYKFDGSSWSRQTSNTNNALLGIWGIDANNVWAVGASGTIVKYDGSSWSVQTSGTSSQLWGVWGADANNVWAVGANSTVRKFDGSSWSAQTGVSSTTLRAVSGAGGVVWATGDPGNTFNTNVPEATSSLTAGTATGTATACVGIASTNQSFTVSGSDLTANIVATAPADFEVSTSATTGFGPSLTLTQSGGSVAATTLYVRTTATATAGAKTGSVTLSSAGATSRTVPVSSTVNALTAFNITPTPSLTIAIGGSLTLTTSGADSFVWSTGESTTAITLSNVTSVTTISVTGTSGECSATATAQVSLTLPAPSLTPSALVVCSGTPINVTAGCQTGTANFTANPAVGSPSGNVYSFNENTPAGIYSLSATCVSNGINSAVGTLAASLTINQGPTISISPSTTAIGGGQSVTLSASGASAPGNYTWSTADTGDKLVKAPTQTTVYSVSASSNGCTSTASATVTVECPVLIPASIVSVTQTAVLGPGNCSVTLQGKGFGNAFSFTGPGGYIFSGVYRRAGNYTVNAPNITQPGSYTFSVKNSDACGRSSTETITYVVTGTACR